MTRSFPPCQEARLEQELSLASSRLPSTGTSQELQCQAASPESGYSSSMEREEEGCLEGMQLEVGEDWLLEGQGEDLPSSDQVGKH